MTSTTDCHDTQTRSVLQTDQRDTALVSEIGTVKPSADGSVDADFGPRGVSYNHSSC